MLALVTGSTGFIGSQLCRGLLEAGWQVRAFHRPNSSLAALEGLPVEHVLGDITRQDGLMESMQGVQVVFHAAALLGRRRDPAQMYAVTVEGTRRVLEAARTAGVGRVVHTSSVAALGPPVETDQAWRHTGNSPATFPLLDEHHTWNYRPEWWRYGHAKYLAEGEVQRAVAQGLDVVIVNPAIVIGAGDLNRVSGDILIRVAKRQVPAAVQGGLNVIHIDDVVRGHLAALERGRTGERYILGAENLSITDFLGLAAGTAGVPAPRLVLPTRLVRSLALAAGLAGRILPVSGDFLRQAGYYFWYDHSKAVQELQLGELRPAREAMRAALEWYCQRGDLAC